MYMTEENWTTLSLREDTKEKLRDRKIHPNQSFDEVLREVLGDKDD